MKEYKSLVAIAILLCLSALFLAFQLASVTEERQAIEEKLKGTGQFEFSENVKQGLFALKRL